MTTANIQTMLGYIRQRPTQKTFLSDMFIKARNVHGTKALVFDQVFGNNEISPYVGRKHSGHVVGKDGFQSLTHFAPYVKEKMEFNEEDADVREPGTTGFTGGSNIDALIARSLDELDMRIVGREELQLAEAIQDGTITVLGDGVSYTVDFQQAVGHIIELTGANRWPTLLATSVAALTAGVKANLQTWSHLPVAAGARRPNVLIGDSNATALIKTAFESMLDTRRADYGFLKPEQMDQYDATYEGRIWGTGFDLNVYTYQAEYEIDGSSSPYMDSYNLVLGHREAPVTLEYGKISNMHAKRLGFKGRRFPNRWIEKDGSAEFITLESSPLVNLRQPNMFVRAHVTAAA